MKLSQIYRQNVILDKNNEFVFSVEVFPAKLNSETNNHNAEIIKELEKLKEWNIKLVSITYRVSSGIENSGNFSYKLAKEIKEKLSLISCLPHFTCINSSYEFVGKYIADLKKDNFKNILTLRGDKPENYKKTKSDFNFANELIDYISSIYRDSFDMAVAVYPEKHPDSLSQKDDLEFLKIKAKKDNVKAMFSQLFFDNSKMFKFVSNLQKCNISKPIVCGILPIINIKQINHILKMCPNVTLPKKLKKNLTKYQNNDDDIVKLGIDFATEQISELFEFGLKYIHFYTLNRTFSTRKILYNLNKK